MFLINDIFGSSTVLYILKFVYIIRIIVSKKKKRFNNVKLFSKYYYIKLHTLYGVVLYNSDQKVELTVFSKF